MQSHCFVSIILTLCKDFSKSVHTFLNAWKWLGTHTNSWTLILRRCWSRSDFIWLIHVGGNVEWMCKIFIQYYHSELFPRNRQKIRRVCFFCCTLYCYYMMYIIEDQNSLLNIDLESLCSRSFKGKVECKFYTLSQEKSLLLSWLKLMWTDLNILKIYIFSRGCCVSIRMSHYKYFHIT